MGVVNSVSGCGLLAQCVLYTKCLHSDYEIGVKGLPCTRYMYYVAPNILTVQQRVHFAL